MPAAFDVAAGSFQCVWFFSLGERHHKPVFEWLQQQVEQQQQQGTIGPAAEAAPASRAAGGSVVEQSAETEAEAAGGLGFAVVAAMKEVPQVRKGGTEGVHRRC